MLTHTHVTIYCDSTTSIAEVIEVFVRDGSQARFRVRGRTLEPSGAVAVRLAHAGFAAATDAFESKPGTFYIP